MKTQNNANLLKNVIKWGCLAPISVVTLIGLFLYIIIYIYNPYVDYSRYGIVDKLDLHYKIKYTTDETEDGSPIYKARLYFSRTDTFETDYVDFRYTEIDYPAIYYFEPDTFYIVDRDGYHVQDIRNKEFNIVYINRTKEDYMNNGSEKIRYEDSVFNANSYEFALYDYATNIIVFDPSGNIIYKKNVMFF